jgi:hypothetical protein
MGAGKESKMKSIIIENGQSKRKFDKISVSIPANLQEWVEMASEEAIYRRALEAIVIAFRHTDGSQKSMDSLLKGIKSRRSSKERDFLLEKLSVRPDALPAEMLSGMKLSSLRDLGAVFGIEYVKGE